MLENRHYIMGKPDINTWRGNQAQQLTFVVTQDCNLRCRYCYMIDKNDKHVMTFETAKNIIDYFIDHRNYIFMTDYLVLDFIGGEPLLQIDLIEQIVEYFIITTYKKKSKWFGRFRIMIQSNGVMVHDERVQRFLKKYKELLSLGITIDGTKVKHDLQRVFPNGEGSYDIVEKNYIEAVRKGYTQGTKVTFGSEDLKYLKESIIHLWLLGIQNVPANIVYEDVWKDGDDRIYLEQLMSLADYILDNHLWDKYNTTFFMEDIGFKVAEEDLMSPACGTGNMYCVDADGNIYNCVRFMDYSLNDKESKKIGDIYHGIDKDRIRPLQTLFVKYLSEGKCLDCKINAGCTYCAGNNYDVSENGSMFYRSTAICKMYQAQVKANNYYWARLYNEQSIRRVTPYKKEYFMYFILSSDSVNYCKFQSSSVKERMKPEDLIKGLHYAFENFYQPVFVHSDDSVQWLEDLLADEEYGASLAFEIKRHIIRHIAKYQQDFPYRDVVFVVDDTVCEISEGNMVPMILNIRAEDISDLSKRIEKILPYTSRININVTNLDKTFDLTEYEKELQELVPILYEYLNAGKQKEVRQLTDRIFTEKMNNCFAGEKNITLAPDGKFYLCPAFYYDERTKNIDTNKVKEMTFLFKSPGCSHCDAFQCDRCIYMNYIGTGELNTSTELQCRMSHLERKYSRVLLEELKESGIKAYKEVNIPSISYEDPVEEVIWGRGEKHDILLRSIL